MSPMAWDPPSSGSQPVPAKAKDDQKTSQSSVSSSFRSVSDSFRLARYGGREVAEGTADKVEDIARDVAHKAGEFAGGVADKVEDAADKAADATGWLARLLKRIVFIVLFPLWLVLMLFGCGPLS